MIQKSTILCKTVGFYKKKYLDKLGLWSWEWLLPFNIDKCNILHFRKINPNIEYNMDEKRISANRTIKNLDTIFEDNF